MLILEQYGVRLLRVREQDIEMIRSWRNQPDVAAFMEYRDHITEEDQKAWFRSIDNSNNYYFVIEFEGKKIGLINAKDYDPEAGIGEGGIFISDPAYRKSFAPVFASLCLLNFMLMKVEVTTASRIRVLRSNLRAIEYNKLLGYRLVPGQENTENQLYELSREVRGWRDNQQPVAYYYWEFRTQDRR